MTDLFIIILPNKSIPFIRTESRRIFNITGCQPSTYNKHGINLHGVLKNAKQVTPEYVADLLTKGASLVFRKRKIKKAKRRATSKLRRHLVREEEVYTHQ